MSDEIVPKEAHRAFAQDNGLPPLGSWHWVSHENDRDGNKQTLMCVSHHASNHVVFEVPTIHGTTWLRIALDDLMSSTRPEPSWREIVMDRMEKTRTEMDRQSKLLREAGVKANALPDPNAAQFDGGENPMLPAIRVTEPAKQKADLLALKERIPVVAKKIDELAKEYAIHAKLLCHSELVTMRKVTGDLRVLEDKIFTLEVYAGLQEEVKQIREGDPAPIEEKIAIRQSILFMDEETLFDYETGGMDFSSIERFDEWVATPENLNRILPELRGVVGFRVRRNMKDYGPVHDIASVWRQAKWNAANMETYLVIRNGNRVYRIASSVDFSPRLFPLRTEFNDAFTREHRVWRPKKDNPAHEDVRKEVIGPKHFDYDNEAQELRSRLKHYSRIVVLIQGLLDRSEVFHPHAPINLARESEFEEWINPVRDEEDGLQQSVESWEDYKNRLNGSIKKGTKVLVTGNDPKERPSQSNWMPKVATVESARKGTERDTCPHKYSSFDRYRIEREGLESREVIGVQGVQFSWPHGQRYGRYEDGLYYRWGKVAVKTRARLWLPLDRVFNLDAYQLGDYKRFLSDRRLKAEYATWGRFLIHAEDYARARVGLIPMPKDLKEYQEEI